MSFALALQSKNHSRDRKTSTPANRTSTHHRINNLNRDSPDFIFHLQRTIGNQAVQRLMHSNPAGVDFAKIGILRKLKISQPGDIYEQEADMVAEQVMRMPVSLPVASSTTMPAKEEEQVDRKCAACEMRQEEEEENEKLNISRKPSTISNLETASEVANEINDVIPSSSSPLDASTKEFMESRFGYDFSNVRIHTDEGAIKSARSVNALAYTIGENIVFDAGYYQPNTLEGRKLLAHELTHVVQQHDSRVSSNGPLRVGEGLSIHRQEAQPSPPVVDATPEVTLNPMRDRLLSQVERLRRIFSELIRYGCWCGPGKVCDEVRDDIDSCCKEHDLAYMSLGVSSGPSSATEVNMWSSEGLKRTMFADLRLVACTQATKFDLHWYGPAAALYREGVALIFGGRAAIAGLLWTKYRDINW